MIINLLPEEEKKSLKRRYYARMFLVGSMLFTAIIFAAILSLLPPIIQLNYAIIGPAHQQAAAAKSREANATSTTLAAIVSEIKDVNAKIAIVNGMPGKMPTGANVTKQSVLISRIIDSLARASQVAHAKVTISNWHFNRYPADPSTKTPAGYNISVSGVAATREVLLALTKELGRNEGIIAVDNPIANYVPGKNSSFVISLIAR
ncbi:MAG: hypothetical protein WC764_02630 [Candidatus Paceibacterota bacterium]|jgi:hypothetical protein